MRLRLSFQIIFNELICFALICNATRPLSGALRSVCKILGAGPLLASSAFPYCPVPRRSQRVGHEVCIAPDPKQEITATQSPFSQLDSPFVTVKEKEINSGIQAQFGSQFIRKAVNTVGPSVVRIDCEREVSQLMSLFSDHYREGDVIKVCGTGFVANDEGFIITNAHVIDQAKKLTITLSNGRSFKAEVVAFDEFTDLAVIKALLPNDRGFQLTPAPLGDSASLHAGDWVIAVGCPVGLDFTVTLGVVSSPRRSSSEVGAPHLKGSYIQTDAALNSGNSGGPLVNDVGEVVGINTMVRTNTEAIGFAIPINRAKQIFEVLKTGKKPTHAFFGLEVMSVTPDSARIHNEDPNEIRLPEVHGALVMRVVPGSPADKAGLRKNDVIVSVGNQVVRSSDDADANLDDCKPGRAALVSVARGEGGARIELQVTPQDLHTLIQEKKKQQQSVVVIKPHV